MSADSEPIAKFADWAPLDIENIETRGVNDSRQTMREIGSRCYRIHSTLEDRTSSRRTDRPASSHRNGHSPSTIPCSSACRRVRLLRRRRVRCSASSGGDSTLLTTANLRRVSRESARLEYALSRPYGRGCRDRRERPSCSSSASQAL